MRIQANPDPDPDPIHTLPSQEVEFLHEKYIMQVMGYKTYRT